MSALSFDERIIAVVRRLTECGVPHAIGGAVSYGYAGVPRATADIDVNIFLPDSEAEATFACLEPLGVTPPDVAGTLRAHVEGQIRLDWQGVWLDLFFAYSAFHESCRARARMVPFADVQIPILSGEDIAIFKVIFNRGRDWVDLERLAAVQGERLDLPYIRQWLTDILGDDDSRVARFEALVAEVAARA